MLELINHLTDEEIKGLKDKETDAKNKIKNSRFDMLYDPNFNFYSRMALFLDLKVEYNWLPTAATDGTNYYYNPEFIMGMSQERKDLVRQRLDALNSLGLLNNSKYTVDQVYDKIMLMYRAKNPTEMKFLTVHEVEHIILNHIERCGDRDPQLFNQAADHSINTTAVKLMFNGDKNKALEEVPFLEDACCDMKYLGWTSEAIYEDLLKESEKNKQEGGSTADYHMNNKKQGSGNDLQDIINKALGIDTNNQPTKTEEQQLGDDIKTQEMIKQAGKQAGSSTPEHIRQLIKHFDEAKIDYRNLLRKSLTSLIKSPEQCYSRPNVRSLVMTQFCRKRKLLAPTQNLIIAGNLPEKTIDVVIGNDTSGSVGDDDIRTVMSEVSGVTKQFNTFRLNCFCWDMEAYDHSTYTPTNINELKNFPIVGRGGTHLTCAFDKIDRDFPDAKSIIIFTDNYVEQVPKDYVDKYGDKTIFIILGNKGSKAQFGTTINYDDLFGSK